MRSGRTVRRGGEDRSWFGRPQAIKKAAGNAATKGTNASNVLASQHHHPLQTISGAVDAVYELPKKRSGPYPPPCSTLVPSTKGTEQGCWEEHLLVVAITTKRLPRSANQEKGGFPVPPVRRIAPFHRKGRIYMFTLIQTLPPSAETLTNKKPLGSLVPGVSVPMIRPAHAPPGKAN